MLKKRLLNLIPLLAVAAALSGIVASSASARNLFRSEKAGEPKSFVLPDAAGVSTVKGGWVAEFGYPIEFVNSGNLTLTATGFSNTCTEGELDTYLNHNSEALNVVELAAPAAQFECEFPTALSTPSGANAVFAAAALELTVSNVSFLVTVGEAVKCVFFTKPEGMKATWTNAVGGEEALGSTAKFKEQKLQGANVQGASCPATAEFNGTFGVETFLQTDPEGPFDTEQVFYG